MVATVADQTLDMTRKLQPCTPGHCTGSNDRASGGPRTRRAPMVCPRVQPCMREGCTGCRRPFAPWWRAQYRTDQALEPQAARTSSRRRPRPVAGRPPRTAAACSWPAAAPGTRAAGAAARAAAPGPPARAGPPASRARRGRCAAQQPAVRHTPWPVLNT